MDKIASIFNTDFARWGIQLPAEGIAQRRRGKIVAHGWAIWYLFGRDADGEYLDYYAAHRMTNDRHRRIHADGRCSGLPTLGGMRLCSPDPEEDARLKAEFTAANREIGAMLRAKGFGIEGDEPGGVTINRALRLTD
jgi:hypothetical protein